ncbi:MAG: alpha/beta fold hydrolase, partial [Acinetobacter sp.]|nr:alpha/beta fold hydrolase [Acinetobacter sp.]
MNLAIQKQRIESFQREGFSFDVIDSGPLDGQPFVLLHGFPETNKSWQETAEILNQNGYRTFAVNQRGYSLGAQPQNRRDYRSSALVEDVNALIDMIQQQVYLVGHDWGAVVAWDVAQRYPEKIKHLITISVPHKAAFMRSMLSSNQLLKSYYIGLFQLPKIPELLFEKLPKLGLGLLKDSGMTAKQLEDFQQDIVVEKRLSSALNWYRGLPFSSNKNLTQPVCVPTLFIWGKHDSAIGSKS